MYQNHPFPEYVNTLSSSCSRITVIADIRTTVASSGELLYYAASQMIVSQKLLDRFAQCFVDIYLLYSTICCIVSASVLLIMAQAARGMLDRK